ncbi:MAG: RluA family pseudouridine synthase [Ruminococcaceae bacterium]|nr:RluA family pseudouridine synthase [Oscillospiraceae bacterium]
MMQRIESVFECNESLRLDVYTAKITGFTRSHATKLIEDGMVLVNGVVASKKYNPKIGDVIVVQIPELQGLEVEAEDIPLDIVYEDEQLLVVNKPKGLVVHPAAGNDSGTLVNALLHHCGNSLSGINGVMRPGILHRIDKNTSGLLIIAKNDFAHNFLAEQIKEHSCNRIYETIVYGNIKADSGTIDAPIGRHPVKRKQMAVTEQNSKNAVTHYEVLERLNGFTHLRLRLETGRTHQIRVHMSYIGHPVAGDNVYGPKKVITKLFGQCLHAKQIGFIHPVSHEYMEFNSELPSYFTTFLEECRR